LKFKMNAIGPWSFKMIAIDPSIQLH
jgi:hypothetical protein